MKTSEIKQAISDGAAEITKLHKHIHETLRYRDKSPAQRNAWENACAEFHARYDALAFPGGYDGAIERILNGDCFTIEVALCFLELRPYFCYSGYMFSKLLRKIKHASLAPDQAERLQFVLARQALWRQRKSGKMHSDISASPNGFAAG
jgi:hypothetical protein